MARGLIPFSICIALVAVLIPYPGLLWYSLAGLALIYFATPTSKPCRRRVQPREERGD